MFFISFIFSIFFLLSSVSCANCSAGEEDETMLNVEFHYAQANIDGCIFNIGDCAYIKVVTLGFLKFDSQNLWQVPIFANVSNLVQ